MLDYWKWCAIVYSSSIWNMFLADRFKNLVFIRAEGILQSIDRVNDHKYTRQTVFIFYNKIKNIHPTPPPKVCPVALGPPRSTAWPSPAGTSSSSCGRRAAEPPPGCWCSAPSARSPWSAARDEDVNFLVFNPPVTFKCNKHLLPLGSIKPPENY